METRQPFKTTKKDQKFKPTSSKMAASIKLDRNSNSSNQQWRRATATTACNERRQLPSFILFLSVVIFLNLCPFQSTQTDFEWPASSQQILADNSIGGGGGGGGDSSSRSSSNNDNNGQRHLTAAAGLWPATQKSALSLSGQLLENLENCLSFIRLMFTNPNRFHGKNDRVRRSYTMVAQAKVLGKVAKMWYIKKKIKKLSKKLKKHTIAVPVFTAIPIYEHSYYPAPHVTHVTHGHGMHHAAAASSYVPTIATASGPIVTTSQSQGQQMIASASNQHQMATYARVAPPPPPPPPHHHYGPPAYHPIGAQNQIINAYAPSPPLFVDEAGGLYGHYGNHYGRYDGGYHVW